ncbi:hypothetical protein AVEN_24876-1 [Araneus ventricosus]|uniref:Uncharacterized protein n=1 Tax=Araneus ventricosus TaxID=182803 RepID=A0A4Y2JMU5_ARAVE|nr:hypothetical protein AVEN_24876-1 [Araneus ventricosus]
MKETDEVRKTLVPITFPHSHQAVEAFGLSVHQFIETVIEEIKVQAEEQFNDGFLDFVICSEMDTCQVLFQKFKEIKNHVVRDPGCREGVSISRWWTCSTDLRTCFMTCSRTK